MPSHPERVRRNYPEGVPAFGATPVYPEICGNWKPSLSQARELRALAVSQSEVPRPPLAATEPPAVQPSTDPQAVDHDYYRRLYQT